MSAARLGTLLSAVLLAAVVAVALAGPALADATREREAQEIAEALNCPVCAGQSVAESTTPLAQQMRALIARKLEQGESREAILQYFVDRYGEGILRQPPNRGFNQLLWWLPLVGLAGGMGIVAVTLHRWRARRPVETPAAPPDQPEGDLDRHEGDLDRYERQLQQDLERW